MSETAKSATQAKGRLLVMKRHRRITMSKPQPCIKVIRCMACLKLMDVKSVKDHPCFQGGPEHDNMLSSEYEERETSNGR